MEVSGKKLTPKYSCISRCNILHSHSKIYKLSSSWLQWFYGHTSTTTVSGVDWMCILNDTKLFMVYLRSKKFLFIYFLPFWWKLSSVQLRLNCYIINGMFFFIRLKLFTVLEYCAWGTWNYSSFEPVEYLMSPFLYALYQSSNGLTSFFMVWWYK